VLKEKVRLAALEAKAEGAAAEAGQSCRYGMEKETWKIMKTAGASPY
jgi:hypothetical protein